MSRPNWAARRLISRRLPGAIALIMLAACGAAQPPASVPTLTLIPAPDTPTPTNIPPTATRASLPGPSDIAAPTPAPSALPDLLTSDPVAAELVRLAQRRLSDTLNVPVSALRLVEVKPYRWADTSLGCPAPGQSYARAEIDGYRIVLAAGEQEYLFHTDFDRPFSCDPADEQLPAGE